MLSEKEGHCNIFEERQIDEALMSRHLMISTIFEKNRASETSQANKWQVDAKFYG